MKNKLFFIFSVSILALQKYTYQKSRGFCETFIQTPISKDESIIDVSPEILEKIKKPIKYLGCGRQSFVFQSFDKSIVIKFISSKRFQNARQSQLLEFELNSYKLAYSHLKKESQILAFKLGKATNLPIVTLIDPFGIKREIDLNMAEFIIQPSATALKDYLQTHSKLQVLDKVKNLLKSRLDVNIFDKDPRIHRNIGVIGDEPFYLDLGAFYQKTEVFDEEKAQEIKKILEYSNY